MRLRKLILSGFKSFADKVEVLFDKGIVAIVGPNGCGKSNISDGIRWVLGEQSAKSIRGGRMPDVIFAGTSSRKALNIAEVTLVFDEVQGVLPVDYEEVAITRRLHRSGESEYLINKHTVRLKDIQGMLMDSGIGHQAYAIFEQGKIDQVIQYSPVERRYIFEEAAGIVRFLQRKKDAMRKLEGIHGNLDRVRDIVKEIDGRIESLSEQAEKAKLYKESKARLEVLEKAVLVTHYRMLVDKYDDITEKRDAIQKALKEHEEQLAKLEVSVQEEREILSKTEKAYLEKKEQLFKARGEKEVKLREKQNVLERLQEAASNQKKWEHELTNLREVQEKRIEEAKAATEKQKQCQSLLKEKEQLLKEKKALYQALEETVAALREEEQKRQQQERELTARERVVQTEYERKQIHLENTASKLTTLKQEQATLNTHLQMLQSECATLEQTVATLDTDIKNAKEAVSKNSAEVQALQEQLQEIQQTTEQTKTAITEAKARLRALEQIKKEMPGFSKGAKRLAERARPLTDLLIPIPGKEEMVAAALKPYLTTFAVETETQFAELLAWIDAEGITDVALICLETLPKKSSPPDSLAHWVEPSPLADTLLAGMTAIANRQAAAAACGQWERIICSTQEAFDCHGVFWRFGKGEQSVFGREAEMKQLSAQVNQDEKQLEQLQKQFTTLSDEKKEASLRRQTAEEHQRHVEKEHLQNSLRVQNLKREEKAKSDAIKQHENALQNTSQQQQTLQTEVTTLQEKLNVLIHEREQLSPTSTPEVYESKLKLLTTERHAFQQLQEEYQSTTKEVQQLTHTLHVIELQNQESEKQQTKLTEEIAIAASFQEKMQTQSTGSSEDMVWIEKKLKEADEVSSHLEEDIQKRQKGLSEKEGTLIDLHGQIKELEKKENQLNIHAAQNETTRENLIRELQETCELTLSETENIHLPEGLTLEQGEKELKHLRHKMATCGDINLTAIDELTEQKERSHSLTEQVADLEASEYDLAAIISQLDEESRTQFATTFETVREHFRKNFAILFEGGEADLKLQDSADLLEAGVEIIAKPPGKQMRSIQLMSGGEKCLTALALLFAIFAVKPAPFCILDEIDAPLDDANVERFCRMVKAFADTCQFIVITHNKRTMAMADTLFGVTMQEKGVSRLLSLRFNPQEEPAASLV
ncbi:MAG: chromosome segregation protein SMC [Chlamydiia bacterium]|nr:chromosome segregation protein SMC [Chlamydiia bacterium]